MMVDARMVPESPQSSQRAEPSIEEEHRLLAVISTAPEIRKRRTLFVLLERLQAARRGVNRKSHREIAREFEVERELRRNKNKVHFKVDVDELSCDGAGQKLLLRLARTLAKFYAGPLGATVDWIITLQDGVLTYSWQVKKAGATAISRPSEEITEKASRRLDLEPGAGGNAEPEAARPSDSSIDRAVAPIREHTRPDIEPGHIPNALSEI
jgi:hypothetical protein